MVVQRPEDIEVTGGDGLEKTTGLEHVHAGFGVCEVLLYAVGLAFDQLAGGAGEEHNGGGEGPVTDERKQGVRTGSKI